MYVLWKLQANVSEVRSVQRITKKFQTLDNVSDVIVSGGETENYNTFVLTGCFDVLVLRVAKHQRLL